MPPQVLKILFVPTIQRINFGLLCFPLFPSATIFLMVNGTLKLCFLCLVSDSSGSFSDGIVGIEIRVLATSSGVVVNAHKHAIVIVSNSYLPKFSPLVGTAALSKTRLIKNGISVKIMAGSKATLSCNRRAVFLVVLVGVGGSDGSVVASRFRIGSCGLMVGAAD